MKKLMMVLALAMLGGLVNLRAADAAQTGECDATQPNNMTEAGKAILLYIRLTWKYLQEKNDIV